MSEKFTPLSPEEISRIANDLDHEEQSADDQGQRILKDTFKVISEPNETDQRIQDSAKRIVGDKTKPQKPYYPKTSQERSNADEPPIGQPDARRNY